LKVEILNLYSNVALPNSGLIGDHGQSFLIKIENEQILFDVGTKGKILLHNMKKLGVDPNAITLLIFSHGHYDHTGALPQLLDARTTNEPLKILAHPDAKLPRKMIIGFIKKNSINIPKLTEEQQAKVKIEFDKAPRKITENIRTTGEITERPYKQGIEKEILRKIDGHYEVDKVTDDMSVIIETIEGQVVITGCAHAGILNICMHAKETSNKPIKAILGGTHMVRYTRDEVLATAEKFVKEFDDPDLYLNHCTDKLPVKFLKKTHTIDILRAKFGEKKIKNCYVGTKLTFDL